MKKIAFVSDHASPLSAAGGVDSGGQNVYVAQVATHLAQLGCKVDVFTRRDREALPEIVDWRPGVRVIHVPAGAPAFVRKEELLPVMPDFAAWVGAFARRHGAYDLANQLHAPTPDVLSDAGYPNQVDPRGLATFGFAGIGLLLFGWLMSQTNAFPKRLAQLAYLAGALNVIIYLARLIILTPSNPIVLAVAGITGLIINPAFFIWLGLRLRALARA